MSVQVKAADVMASDVEKLGRAASTEPARTFSCNWARNSGRTPAQSFTLGAQPGGAKSPRSTVKVCGRHGMDDKYDDDTGNSDGNDRMSSASTNNAAARDQTRLPSCPHVPRIHCATLRHFETREWRLHRAGERRCRLGEELGACAAMTALQQGAQGAKAHALFTWAKARKQAPTSPLETAPNVVVHMGWGIGFGRALE